MTGKELMYQAKSCPAATSCVPLNFIPTAPRMGYQDGWTAEFWYYTADYRQLSVNLPMYYLELELPGFHPTAFRRLRKVSACLGQAAEIADKSFYTRQNEYLERCAQLVNNGAPSAQALQELERSWLDIQPEKLKVWLMEHLDGVQPASEVCQKPGKAPEPQNLVEYWKQEMAKAIRAGDTQRAKLAQLEMNKAAKK